MLKITDKDLSDILQSINIALNLINDSNISITKVSLHNDFTPILFICLDADVDTIVDLNFELADKIVDLYEGDVKFSVYFSAGSSADFVS